MMTCSEVQKKILKGEPLTVEEQLHVLECQECQSYSGICLSVLGQPAVPPELDDVILGSAVTAARKGRLRRRRIRQWLYSGAAAALVIVAGLCWHCRLPEKEAQVAHNTKGITHENMLLILADENENLDAIENELAVTSLVCLD